MKNITKAFLVLSLAILPSLCLASTFDTNVKFGDKGPEVVKLQQLLKTTGFFTADITGNFFGITKQAVKDFQTAHGVISTGYFGPLSRAVANSLVVEESEVTVTPTTTVQITQIGTSTQKTVVPVTPQQQMIHEEPLQTIIGSSAPAQPEMCASNGSDIWNEVTYSDPRAKSFVWFGQSKEFASFNVTQTASDTVQITIPGSVRNDSGMEISYQLFYSVADVGTQLTNTENVTSVSQPITVTLPGDYIGHKVAFQLLVAYTCLHQYTGWNYMKATGNSFQYLQM